MNAQQILIQIVITTVVTIIVVTVYHLLFSRKTDAAHTIQSRSGDSAERRQLPETLPAPVQPAATPPPTPATAVPIPVAATVVTPPPAPVVMPAPVAATVGAPTPPAFSETSPEILAVIAAAIAVVIGKAHRVVAVQPTVPAPSLNVWALEGRVEQFMSHRVR